MSAKNKVNILMVDDEPGKLLSYGSCWVTWEKT